MTLQELINTANYYKIPFDKVNITIADKDGNPISQECVYGLTGHSIQGGDHNGTITIQPAGD